MEAMGIKKTEQSMNRRVAAVCAGQMQNREAGLGKKDEESKRTSAPLPAAFRVGHRDDAM